MKKPLIGFRKGSGLAAIMQPAGPTQAAEPERPGDLAPARKEAAGRPRGGLSATAFGVRTGVRAGMILTSGVPYLTGI